MEAEELPTWEYVYQGVGAPEPGGSQFRGLGFMGSFKGSVSFKGSIGFRGLRV